MRAQVVGDELGEVDRPQVQAQAALVEAVGGKEVVDQGAQPRGVAEHGVDEGLQLLRRRLAAAERLQVQLQRGQRRLELVGDLGDEVALGPVEGGLAAPEEEDDVDSGEDRGEQQDPLDQDEPVDAPLQQFGAVLGRQAADPLVALTNQTIQKTSSTTQISWMAMKAKSGLIRRERRFMQAG